MDQGLFSLCLCDPPHSVEHVMSRKSTARGLSHWITVWLSAHEKERDHEGGIKKTRERNRREHKVAREGEVRVVAERDEPTSLAYCTSRHVSHCCQAAHFL